MDLASTEDSQNMQALCKVGPPRAQTILDLSYLIKTRTETCRLISEVKIQLEMVLVTTGREHPGSKVRVVVG